MSKCDVDITIEEENGQPVASVSRDPAELNDEGNVHFSIVTDGWTFDKSDKKKMKPGWQEPASCGIAIDDPSSNFKIHKNQDTRVSLHDNEKDKKSMSTHEYSLYLKKTSTGESCQLDPIIKDRKV